MNVSLITACKNRYNPLLISLQSWLLFDEVKEIIIVDWSSDEPLSHLTELDPRIKVITVPNKKYFNQPQPLNLAASIATGDSIMKFDIDYIINPYYNFFKAYPIDENTFVSGKPNYQSPEYLKNGVSMVDFGGMNFDQIYEYCNIYSPYYKSLIGLLHITRENFFKCGGYNEDLGEYYGFEDEELQNRLESLGLNHTKLNYDHNLIHIPHPDSKRTEHFVGTDDYAIQQMENNLAQFYSGDQIKYQLEYAIAQYHINKNKEYFSNPETHYIPPKTKWNIKQINSQNYIATEMNNLENFPPVYYVTLEDCVERQQKLEDQFAKYDIVPKAIKSKRFSESDDVITGKYVYQLTGPTQGCIVSHLKAIKTWYESEESEYAFFCEDDLSLKTVDYWNFTWEEFIERLPDDCECVQLMTIRGDFDDVNFRDRKWDDWSETAYIMNRDYAKKLIDNYCIGNVFHLELKGAEVMPIGENILFTDVGKVYTFPLFVENVQIPTTDVNDLELEHGQKPNHVYASEYVYNWWKKNGNMKTIDQLMGTIPIKKSFVISEEETSSPSSGDTHTKEINFDNKTELEQLLHHYSLDTENPHHNFNLGLWYEKQGHTAPALSYFLRCAERATDDDFVYEALLKSHHCYDKQGTRDGTAISLLQQAMCVCPKRPEAYFLLARFHERRSQWHDSYKYASLGLSLCDFDSKPTISNVEYPGKYGLLYEKAVSGYWWGKGQETRKLLREIKENYEVDQVHFQSIQDNLMRLGSGHISEEEIKYNKNKFDSLKFKFPGSEKIEKNYSQAYQDLFTLAMLNGKKNGLYLEIGAQEPFYQNNTALLETMYDWDGISIEIREDLCKMFSEQRKNTILCKDATKIDYEKLLDENNKGTVYDYLQLDCEPASTTFEILTSIPFEKYKFAIITYEHDYSADASSSYRSKSRRYLSSLGYELAVKDVAPNDEYTFEDWWVHPDLVDPDILSKMRSVDVDVTNVIKYFFE